MSRGRAALLVAVVTLAPLLVPVAAGAATVTMTLAPKIGPATTPTTITGSGFGANEAVDVFGGTADLALTVANASGAVSTTVAVPATAAAGTFWFTLVGRHSGRAAQAAFAVHADVAQSGTDAGRRMSNGSENQIRPANADDLDLAWDKEGLGAAPVAVVKGVVYATGGQVLKALDEVTGAVTWSKTLPCAPAGTPAVAATVDIGCSDGSVVALNPATGAIKWRYQQPVAASMTRSVQVLNNRVYGITDAGEVFALLPTGALAWSLPVDSPQALVVSGSSVYLTSGSSAYFVSAFAVATGALLWSTTLGSGSNRIIDLVMGPEGLFASFRIEGVVYRVDPGSGVLENADFGGPGLLTPLTLLGRRLYAVSATGSLVAYSSADTEVLWQSSATVSTFAVPPPFATTGVVWVAGTGFAAASGAQVAVLNTYPLSPVVVTDGRVFESLQTHLSAFALPTATPAARPDPAALRI